MSNKQKQKTMENLNATCQITFRSNKKLRFIKGSNYMVLPMVGIEGLKLFRIYAPCGESFFTDENHVNKFFKFN